MFSVVMSLLLCATSLQVVRSHSHYQLLIPNGEWVPSPCQQNTVWMGVGHRRSAGGGPRNPFGLHFANNNHNWTQVCRLDSDGDGKTNGQELGDPDCTWKPGTTPSRLHGLSHPAVCEPLNSTICLRRNRWMRCPKPSNCQAINQTAVLKKTWRFPSTQVPEARNTHMCLGVRLPDDVTVNGQLPIGVEPYLDNRVVMHHINFWRCTDIPSDESYATPKRCRKPLAGRRLCRGPVRLWTTGQTIRCTPTERLGYVNATHLTFKYAVVELHWRNELLSSDHRDGSGLVMYYRDSGTDVASAALMTICCPLTTITLPLITALFYLTSSFAK